MEYILAILTQYGYIGLFIGAFLAGSAVPFSSETLLIACVGGLKMNPTTCLIAASIGNVLGGLTCYYIGSLGRLEWIEKYLHVKKEKLERAKAITVKYGAWVAFFSFIPLLGSAILIALGIMRANWRIMCLSMVAGKCFRYAIVIWGTVQVIN